MALIQEKQVEFTGDGPLSGAHRGYDQLVHNIAETAFTEFIYSGTFLTDKIIWTNNLKTTKIRETNYTYLGNRINTITKKQYDDLGVLIVGETLTDTYTFTGNNVTSVDSVLV